MRVPDVRKIGKDLPDLDPTCPICGKPSIFIYRPFCSKRCADIDLNNWFKGSYVIETQEEEEVLEKI